MEATGKFVDKKETNTHELTSLTLTKRQLCDLELLLNGGFAPVVSFMNRQDYESVLNHMRLANGALWPMPITLDVDSSFAKTIDTGETIALRDEEGLLLAILEVEDIWQADKKREAQAIFATDADEHPGVFFLYHQCKQFYIGGKLHGVTSPYHYDFNHLRHSPADLRAQFRKVGWDKIVAFQTRNPMHKAHFELTQVAAQKTGAKILLHPVVGLTKKGDIEYYVRVRCYEHILSSYPQGAAFLSLLPLAMRMAGPREALWHALIRKNYGATHFIVGRDHAGPGKTSAGVPFYPPYQAQELVVKFQKEIGIEILPFQEMLYSQKQARYFPADLFPQDETPLSVSGTELRERLQKHLDIPEWFSYPQVITELRKVHPPKHKQGFTVFFTGLPCSGKSTLANALALKLREILDRPITLLDGDIIRTHLSQGLGFSQADREANITRVGFVATEITRHGGIAICALVAPFDHIRKLVRSRISEVGGYIEVHVATPLSVCEERDRKGLYKKAREGIVKQFTGISDPYEDPVSPEIKIDTSNISPHDVIEFMVNQLKTLGYIQ